jgi:hypothetical protein
VTLVKIDPEENEDREAEKGEDGDVIRNVEGGPDGPLWVIHCRHGWCRQASHVRNCSKADLISMLLDASRMIAILSN